MEYDLIIKNGTIYDGIGTDCYCADIGVEGDKIAKIGDLSGCKAKQHINAANLCVTPGFIDAHSHADLTVLFNPSMDAYIRQGVTTVVGGNCGHALAPLGDELYRSAIVDSRAVFKVKPSYFNMTTLLLPLQEAKIALKDEYNIDVDWKSFGEYVDKCNERQPEANIVPLIGYSAVRAAVMGEDCMRAATEQELVMLEELTRQCMEEGAFGLSTGTDPQYVPGPFATDDEVVRMLKIVKEYDGIFSSHTRNMTKDGKPGRMMGYKEMLTQARLANIKANVSHVHVMGMGTNAQECTEAAKKTIEYFEEEARNGLDISFDIIPSPYTSDFTVPYFSAYLRPFVMMSGSRVQLAKNFSIPDYRQMVHTVIEAGMYPMLDSKRPMNIYNLMGVTKHKNSSYIGKNLFLMAKEKEQDPLDLVMDIFAEDCDMSCEILMPGFAEANEILCRHPMAMPCSDGISCDKGTNIGINDDLMMKCNPMNLCFMIKYITSYGKPRFEDTVHQITNYVAQRFNIKNRGILKEGMYADIVVMDKDNLCCYDREADPLQYPDGIEYVVVNGKLALEKGKKTGTFAGRVLKRN